jgi:5-(carboxyamino)imidazole ribonucleotide mutase/phosphoribosylaminoimidazole-succinocarboxamide synthase
MGSRSDLEHGKAIADALDDFGIPTEIRVASAHKSPTFLLDLLANYESDGGQKVYITVAGRSNALSALIDAQVTAPVIACPPYSSRFGGADIFSSLRMPSGVAPAVVVAPAGAALVAAKIFALANPSIADAISRMRVEMSDKIRSDDADLNGGSAQ